MNGNILYAPAMAWQNGFIDLDEAQVRHLRVLRLVQGAEVGAIDGEGRIAHCRILEITKYDAKLEILSSRHVMPEKSRAIIALAFSKAARRGFFMEKAVELGAFAIWIWQAENSQGRIPPCFEENIHGKLVAGAKQCGNPWLPGVRTFGSLKALLLEANDVEYRILPLERQLGQPLPDMGMLGCPGTTLYMIGPEGGFSDTEISALNASAFTSISLGERVLRCETAAMLCLGLHYWAAQVMDK